MRRIFIQGNNLATVNLAINLRKYNFSDDITLLLEDTYNTINDITLKSLTDDFNIIVKEEHELTKIEPKKSELVFRDKPNNNLESQKFDYLILSNKSNNKVFKFVGSDNDRVLYSNKVKQCNMTNISKDKVTLFGSSIDIISLSQHVLNNNSKTIINTDNYLLSDVLEPDLSRIVENYLLSIGFNIYNNDSIFKYSDNLIKTKMDHQIESDQIIICTKEEVDIDLLSKSKINFDKKNNNYIDINKNYQTNFNNVFTIGKGTYYNGIFYYDMNCNSEIDLINQSEQLAKHLNNYKLFDIEPLNEINLKVKDLKISSFGTYYLKNKNTINFTYSLSDTDYLKIFVEKDNHTLLSVQYVGLNDYSDLLSSLKLCMYNYIVSLCYIVNNNESHFKKIFDVFNGLLNNVCEIIKVNEVDNHSNAFFLDIRPENDFNNYNVNNSVNISQKNVSKKIQTLQPNLKREVIIIYDNLDDALFTSIKLKQLQYEKIYILDGGIYFFKNIMED